MAFNKEELTNALTNAGDACIHFISPVSGKEKYTVGTIDFSTKYIADKLKSLKTSKATAPESILIFAWDTDSFKQVDPFTVTKIEPLNQMIQNDRV